ncbi:NADPH-dependent F420 reductase [Nocardiopsis dassonvillei]|uniref:NADPH-dependent F420 reductase n=2 Tax=Nocardiopsis dassonvillei TaxID=2014 RepID=UPI000B9D751E|nr:NAD(P)-binding domain-containing protein [Nocardiopsis dassonvillei]ASU58531.1 NADP oxidoreductase [Nocardiopsis dassonvillei]
MRQGAHGSPGHHEEEEQAMSTLGIIGSGNIGTAIARLAVAAGIDVVIANSRGPQSLAGLVEELGPRATAATVEEAARAGEATVLSIPLTAYGSLPEGLLRGRTVLDTGNYYPFRDGRIAELDSEEMTTTALAQRLLPGALLVKAFNNIMAHHIPQLARPAGAADRSALPIAGGDPGAKARAAVLIDRLGFDTVDAGTPAESWRFEPESGAYTRIYLADPDVPVEQMMQAPAAPVSAEELRTALEGSRRVKVAERTF